MLFAAIDIGSNAGRLMFANAYEKEGTAHVEKATLIRIPLRLGSDVFKKGKISAKRTETLLKTMQAFKLLIDVYNPVAFKAVATAALREARNGKSIVSRIEEETGIKMKIIDGREEANIIRKNIGFILPPENRYSLFVDVGGGSTELSLTDGDKLIDLRSFKIGTIRILNEQVPEGEWDALSGWLDAHCEEVMQANIIGSGGNINKINKIYGNPQSITLFQFQLTRAYEHLRSFSLEDRVDKLGLRPDRADVIVPAAQIFLFIMHHCQAESIVVPKIGLVDGLVHELYRKEKSKSE